MNSICHSYRSTCNMNCNSISTIVDEKNQDKLCNYTCLFRNFEEQKKICLKLFHYS